MTDHDKQPRSHGDHQPADAEAHPPTSRRPWVAPEVRELPKLNDLTLDTFGNPIGGGFGVFP